MQARLVCALIIACLGGAARAAATELTVAAYPPFDASVKVALPRWQKLHPGVKVRLVSRGFAEHHDWMLTGLAGDGGVPDVMALEVSYVGRFAATRAVEDLGAAFGADELMDRLVPFTVPQASAGTDAIAALPVDVGPGTLFYRTDILEKAGVSEEELTRSWESFIAAGKKVRQATGAALIGHASDIADAYIRANVPPEQGLYRDAARRFLADPPRFVEAFALARDARKAGADARAAAWSSEWVEGVRGGSIAAAIGGAWMADHLAGWVAPDTSGQWRAAPLPGGALVPYGGSFLAIPRRAAHRKAAWDFVKFMCFDVVQQRTALHAARALPALKAAWTGPEVEEPIPFLGSQRARRLWKTVALKIAPVPVDRLDHVSADIIHDELSQVLERGKEIPRAIIDARDQVVVDVGQ